MQTRDKFAKIEGEWKSTGMVSVNTLVQLASRNPMTVCMSVCGQMSGDRAKRRVVEWITVIVGGHCCLRVGRVWAIS